MLFYLFLSVSSSQPQPLTLWETSICFTHQLLSALPKGVLPQPHGSTSIRWAGPFPATAPIYWVTLIPPSLSGDQSKEGCATSPGCRANCSSSCRPTAVDPKNLCRLWTGAPHGVSADPTRRITVRSLGFGSKPLFSNMFFSSLEKQFLESFCVS